MTILNKSQKLSFNIPRVSIKSLRIYLFQSFFDWSKVWSCRTFVRYTHTNSREGWRRNDECRTLPPLSECLSCSFWTRKRRPVKKPREFPISRQRRTLLRGKSRLWDGLLKIEFLRGWDFVSVPDIVFNAYMYILANYISSWADVTYFELQNFEFCLFTNLYIYSNYFFCTFSHKNLRWESAFLHVVPEHRVIALPLSVEYAHLQMKPFQRWSHLEGSRQLLSSWHELRRSLQPSFTSPILNASRP